MNISSVNSFIGNAIQPSGTANGSAAGQAVQDGDNDGGRKAHGGRRGGGQLFNAVAQTLSQLDMGAIGSAAVPPPASAQGSITDNNTENALSSDGTSIKQELNSFMHALFQAFNSPVGSNNAVTPGRSSAGTDADSDSDGSGASSESTRNVKSYSDLTSQLQNLLQSLSSGSQTTTTSVTGSGSSSELNSAFQNLTKALQGSGGAGGAGTTDLQTFLQTLIQNLQNGGASSISGAGNMVSTTA